MLMLIEWLLYDRFKDVKQIGRGGSIGEWDIENQQWKRYSNREVALKKFENFVNFNDVLSEMEIHLKTLTEHSSIRFYGITQDTETHIY
ncbi:hypothetical protein Glove_136g55 [Diversispora epigaea]|uniref:Protein kinase domain-containing protein n=1 Tax=Diversispora epigaea TaxID=1348612 RepID=A0A397J316_9GLOM|nr:hypothetical protein Glove_136g55 [Diversispora epigaea]